MPIAAGLWIFVFGYALVYAGSSYFLGTPVSLAQAFGIGTIQNASATTTSTPTQTKGTASPSTSTQLM